MVSEPVHTEAVKQEIHKDWKFTHRPLAEVWPETQRNKRVNLTIVQTKFFRSPHEELMERMLLLSAEALQGEW